MVKTGPDRPPPDPSGTGNGVSPGSGAGTGSGSGSGIGTGSGAGGGAAPVVRQPTSSTVVRRQLGRRLRALREEAGKTREDVAATKLMSRGKLELIEFGRTTVRPGDVYELGILYEAPDDVIAALRELAVATTQDGWWQEHGGNVAKAFETYLDLEAAAAEVDIFEPLVIHGLFQTENYARAVERGSNPHLSAEVIEGNVRVRLARQKMLLTPARGRKLRAILGEAALRLQVAGPVVMREQYDRLVRLARSGVVELRVLPFASGAHSGVFGPFAILGFADPEDPSLAYVESYAGVRYHDREVHVQMHRTVYSNLLQGSVPLEEFPYEQ